MTKYRSFAAVAFALALMGTGAVVLSGSVSAAPPAGTTVSGTVKLDGAAPHQKGIDMSKEPSCAAIHKDKPATMESVVAGPGGGLANVVVYVSQGLSGNESPSSEAATITQKGCQYIPHVVAVDAGQHMKVVNADRPRTTFTPSQPRIRSGTSRSRPDRLRST